MQHILRADYFGTANSTNWKDPYTEQYALNVERSLGRSYAIRASYIGSETHQLVWAPDENTLLFSNTVSAYNQPLSARLFPNWGRINTRATSNGSSSSSDQGGARTARCPLVSTSRADLLLL